MRAEDHQIIAPIFVMSFVKAGQQGVKHDVEGTGYRWKTDISNWRSVKRILSGSVLALANQKSPFTNHRSLLHVGTEIPSNSR
jgi:hypothetical protein